MDSNFCIFIAEEATASLGNGTRLLFWVNWLQQTAVIKQLMEAFQSPPPSFLPPDHKVCCTASAAARPSQGEAFNCFFAGGSS